MHDIAGQSAVIIICTYVLCVLILSLSLSITLFSSLSFISLPPSLSLPSLFSPSLPLSLSSQDETLVHCSLSPLENPEFTFDVEFEGEVYDVSVLTLHVLEAKSLIDN